MRVGELVCDVKGSWGTTLTVRCVLGMGVPAADGPLSADDAVGSTPKTSESYLMRDPQTAGGSGQPGGSPGPRRPGRSYVYRPQGRRS